MKLIETPEEQDEGPQVEELVGALDETTEDQAWTAYAYRTLDRALLAPLRIAWNDWRTRFGVSVIAMILFMAYIWAPMYPKSYRGYAPSTVQPFNWEYTQTILEFTIGGFHFPGITIWKYPLGTTLAGEGILQNLVNAAPAMVELVIAGSVVSVGLAVVVGTIAGYKGGSVDNALMGLTDIALTIPGLPLILLLAAIFQPKDPFILGMILAIDSWPGLARSIRSQILTIRNESYVEASRTMGITTSGILRRDIVPQITPYVMINAATAGKGVIMQAVALYFLNFIEITSANWGQMMDAAYRNGAVTNPERFYLIFWPMLALSMLSFGLILLSQGMDQIVNPRLRARHAETTTTDTSSETTNS